MIRHILWCILVAALPLTGKESSRNEAAAENVNSRYTVESVKIAGQKDGKQLSRSTRKVMNQLVGHKLDTHAVEQIATRIQQELGVERVRVRVLRGSRPEHVAVQLEVQRKDDLFDLTVPKIAYHSRQGFSGAVETSHDWGTNRATVRYVNDGDLLAERFSGFQGSYQRRNLGGNDRLALRVTTQFFHQQWNDSSQALAQTVAQNNGIYRNRVAIEPALTIKVATGLYWTNGVSVQHLEMQFPAARTEASNAITSSLRYSKRLEGSGDTQQDIEAGYNLRAATRSLGSDFVFTRHQWNAAWTAGNSRHSVRAAALAGRIAGAAPYYERFVAGNGSTLRGWNKYDVAPLGADRIVHASVDYRYRVFEAFYDAGSVWQPTNARTARVINSDVLQSVGVGFRKDSLQLAVAFPLRAGSVDPIFLIGVNF